MWKVYVETLSRHKQFSQDISDKDISVMYLKDFLHQMEITRVDSNVFKFFWEISNHLASISCRTHIYYDIGVFWIHRLSSSWKYVRYCHIALKLITLAAIGSKNFLWVLWTGLHLSTFCQSTYKIMITLVLFWN